MNILSLQKNHAHAFLKLIQLIYTKLVNIKPGTLFETSLWLALYGAVFGGIILLMYWLFNL